ncbi:MAG: HAMP domain-containing histidine kinase, partial [Elusimicrobia bacterium]|nr:HAMP domain-containing histidine kinase [Elusimicrobiota bacterium]
AVKQAQPSDRLLLPPKSIEREALRCKNLVQDLLVFSRKSKTQLQEIDLNETVRNTLNIIEAQAKVKAVEISIEPGALPPFLGDKSQMQQIIVNLCSNAMDAMPGGGKIAVRTRSDATTDGRYVVLEVQDTGSGIPNDIQDKIFNPFFTTKEVGKGTGLGLSLVYEIIQKHKGTIALKSEVGRGTTFSIRFHAIDPARPQSG